MSKIEFESGESMTQRKATDYKKLTPITPEIRRRIRRADPGDTVSSALSVAKAETGVEIEFIHPDSLGEELGLSIGDRIHKINNQPVRDTIDFFFHSSDESVKMEIESKDGKHQIIEFDKQYPEEHMGLELKQFTTQNCGCNCVFCFVHQLPDSMRKSLYIKDEDYRLGFMQGSYITGITLKEADLERIARQRLTPLYLSVHAVDEELRKWLLGVKKAPAILDVLNFFKKHRIQVHTQIVLCPTHNDGDQLHKTLDALLDLYPTVQSIAIVPLGMTKFRTGLPGLPPVTPEYSNKFLRQFTPRVRTVAEQYGEPIVMLADEWYLIAGRKAPSYSKYPDVPQLENGVGMVYHFYNDFKEAKKTLKQNPVAKPFRVAAMTSTLSKPVLEKVNTAIHESTSIEVTPISVVNDFFGDSIHVTGLLSGKDLIQAIKDNPGFDQYLLPGNCLRKYDQKFLDEITLEEMRKECGVRIDPVLGGSLDYVETVLEAAIGLDHDKVTEHPFLQKHWSNS